MLENLIKLLEYYKSLGEKTFAQLDDEEIHLEPADDANSIAIIVKHLWGNMTSRWTNFLTEDGEKEWRDRDTEFESTIKSRQEFDEKWEEGWSTFLGTLKSLKEEDLSRIVYIRNEGHTVLDAIHRQLAHYASHIGQIIYLGKIIKGSAWQSLSIPKGQSAAYNQEKFSQGKKDQFFTDKA